jgi:hypothetical protein
MVNPLCAVITVIIFFFETTSTFFEQYLFQYPHLWGYTCLKDSLNIN